MKKTLRELYSDIELLAIHPIALIQAQRTIAIESNEKLHEISDIISKTDEQNKSDIDHDLAITHDQALTEIYKIINGE